MIIFVCENCVEDGIGLSESIYKLNENDEKSFEGLRDFFCNRHNLKGRWMTPNTFEEYKKKLIVDRI